MFWGFLLVFLFGNPAVAETITVYGKKIPDADYKLKLDQYNLQLTDYRFPSGLRILFQSENMP